jgi:hypothetical protein
MVTRFLNNDLEGIGYSLIFGTIPAYPPTILRNHLPIINLNVILPSLAGLPTDFLTEVPCAIPNPLYRVFPKYSELTL